MDSKATGIILLVVAGAIMVIAIRGTQHTIFPWLPVPSGGNTGTTSTKEQQAAADIIPGTFVSPDVGAAGAKSVQKIADCTSKCGIIPAFTQWLCSQQAWALVNKAQCDYCKNNGCFS